MLQRNVDKVHIDEADEVDSICGAIITSFNSCNLVFVVVNILVEGILIKGKIKMKTRAKSK
jgi:hypothetical protein